MSLSRPHQTFKTKYVRDQDTGKFDHCHVAHCMVCGAEDYVIINKNARALNDVHVRKKFRQRGWVFGRNRKRDICPQCRQEQQKGKVIDFTPEYTIESVFGSDPLPPKEREPTPRELAQKLTKQLKKAAPPKVIHPELPEPGFEAIESYVADVQALHNSAAKMSIIAERMLDEACALNDQAEVHTKKALELIEALPEERKDQMAFELAMGRRGGYRLEGRQCRLSITKSGEANQGRLVVSRELLLELDWTFEMKIEVHRGTGEDAGRVLVVPGSQYHCKLQELNAGNPQQHGLISTRVVFSDFNRFSVSDVHFAIHKMPNRKGVKGLIVDIPKDAIPEDYNPESRKKVGVAG